MENGKLWDWSDKKGGHCKTPTLSKLLTQTDKTTDVATLHKVATSLN